MGTPQKNQKSSATILKRVAEAPSKNPPSAARQKGRRLSLHFNGEEVPILHKIEFRFSKDFDPEFRKQDDNLRSFQWRGVAKAVCLIFLEYVIWNENGRKGDFYFEGAERRKLTKPLGNAVYKPASNLLEIFSEPLKNGHRYYAQTIFWGQNRAGRAEDNRERRITINQEFLPPDCIEIFWNVQGEDPLKIDGLNALAKQFRKVLGIPEAPPKLEGEGSDEKEASPVETPPKTPPASPADIVTPPRLKEKPPKMATEVFGRKEAPAPEPPTLPLKSEPTPDLKIGEFKIEFKTPPADPEPIEPPEPPPAKIDPRLFEIQNPDQLEWHDSQGLINFGNEDSEADLWLIRDASEGVIIFGAVGSGKTSSTGSLIATQYLRAGYGGLVLTAKTDEAKRWLRLCERTGRAGDCIHVTPGSSHKLNILQYESQRTGERFAVTEGLIEDIENKYLEDAALGKCPTEITYLNHPLDPNMNPELRKSIAASLVGKPVLGVAKPPQRKTAAKPPETAETQSFNAPEELPGPPELLAQVLAKVVDVKDALLVGMGKAKKKISRLKRYRRFFFAALVVVASLLAGIAVFRLVKSHRNSPVVASVARPLQPPSVNPARTPPVVSKVPNQYQESPPTVAPAPDIKPAASVAASAPAVSAIPESQDQEQIIVQINNVLTNEIAKVAAFKTTTDNLLDNEKLKINNAPSSYKTFLMEDFTRDQKSVAAVIEAQTKALEKVSQRLQTVLDKKPEDQQLFLEKLKALTPKLEAARQQASKLLDKLDAEIAGATK